MARGNRRRDIYHDDEDREQYLDVLEQTVERFGWECLAYCLMENHYHLVVRTPLPNLSRGMMVLNSGYAHRYNRRRQEEGHLYQGRFRSVLIRTAGQLLVVLRYVLRNPIASGLCEHPNDWRWSSYAATTGSGSAGPIARQATLAWFGGNHDASQRFGRFICAQDIDPIGAVLDADSDLPTLPRDPGEQRPTVEAILGEAPGDPGIALAYNRFGYSFAEIGTALGCSHTTVRRRLVAYESRQMLESPAWPPGG